MSTADTALTAPPQTVKVSSILHIVGAILGLVGAVVVLITLPALLNQASTQVGAALQGQDTGGIDVVGAAKGLAIGSAVFSVVLTIVFSVLTIVFARKMRQGKNWARIVLIVFALLQIFGVIGSYGVGALHFLVVLVAFILSVLPASNAWFRAIKGTQPVV